MGNSARSAEKAFDSIRDNYVATEKVIMRQTSAMAQARAELKRTHKPGEEMVEVTGALRDKFNDLVKQYPQLREVLKGERVEYAKIRDVLKEIGAQIEENRRLRLEDSIRDHNTKLAEDHGDEVRRGVKDAQRAGIVSKVVSQWGAASDAARTGPNRLPQERIQALRKLGSDYSGHLSWNGGRLPTFSDEREKAVFYHAFYQAEQEQIQTRLSKNKAYQSSVKVQELLREPGVKIRQGNDGRLFATIEQTVAEIIEAELGGDGSGDPSDTKTTNREETLLDRLLRGVAEQQSRQYDREYRIHERAMQNERLPMPAREQAYTDAGAALNNKYDKEKAVREAALRVQYNADKIQPGTREDALYQYMVKELGETIEVERRDALDALNKAKDDAFKPKKLQLRSSAVDKQTTYAQRDADRRAELEKEQAWTAEEVYEIETRREQKQQEFLQQRKAVREEDIAALKERIALNEKLGLTSDEEQRQLDALEDELTDITYQMELQAKLVNDRLTDSPMTALERGARSVARQVGTVNQGFELMGEKLMTFGTDGIADGLWSMVDALREGENAWKAFRQTMGQMLMDIGKELTKYYLKLMLVWAIKQALGWAGYSEGGSVSQAGEGAFDVDNAMASGKYSLMDGMAEGGPIPADMGTPGVDSVPALLMPGEFVVRKSAVDYYGLDTFRKMNVKRFADGGYVGNGAGSIGGNSGEEETVTFQIVNVVAPRSIPKTTAEEIVNVISLDAMNNGAAIRTIKARIRG